MQRNLFEQLLTESQKQTGPARLLFLFAKAQPMTNKVKTDHKSGTVTPIMCVDKLPAELSSYEELVKEADGISSNWDFVLVSSMTGKNGVVPSSTDADFYLSKMSNDLALGRNIDNYLILDRNCHKIILA